MRDVERMMIGLNLMGSLIKGAQHDLTWLPLPVIGFAAYLVIQDRMLRARIGPRAWPSERFARFDFGTNLYFCLWNLVVGAIVFAVAGTVASAAGF